ncbi:MAG: pilus assembly protein PilM, partial [Kiritimatiellia bacterium]
MTRLHAEVSRSISFYRSQQEGKAPTRVLLTGASAQLPYMQNFFEEKLQIEVDFLNPFQTVAYPENIDTDKFGRDAFALSVLVGLALRRGLTCPVEVNLVSEEIVARKDLRKRLPFFAIALAGLIFITGIWLIYVGNMRSLYETQYEATQSRVDDYLEQKELFDTAEEKAQRAEARAKDYQMLLAKRLEWTEMLVAVDSAVQEGMWVTSLKARRNGAELQGLDLSVSVWKDLEPRLLTSGKTIDETVAARLAATSVFSDDVRNIPISKKDQSVSWMTSFNITAKLKSLDTEKQSTRSTRGRRGE